MSTAVSSPKARKNLVRTISTKNLESRWLEEYKIDTRRFFEFCDELVLECDHDSGLLFFEPRITGDAKFYADLEKIEWYYLSEKWEFDRVLCGLSQSVRILEIGSGDGAFLAKASALGHQCVGLELNSVAAARARAVGLDVRETSLGELLSGLGEKFDRVVSFQVLEHVANPIELLIEMKGALRPGGAICIAVPNVNCFASFSNTLFDLPPHHVSRWSVVSMHRIARLLESQLHAVEEAPLEEVHFDWFSEILIQRCFGRLRAAKRLKPIVLRLLRRGLASRIRGHTLYAEFKI